MTLNLTQASQRVGVPRQTLERWARQGVLPSRTVAGELVFREHELISWAQDHHVGHTKTNLPPATADFCQALRAGGVHAGIQGDSVEAVLRGSLYRVNPGPRVDRETLLQHLLAREKIASTGIGGGVAIPHPHQPDVFDFDESLVACCYLEEAIPFGALDEQPVSTLFLLLARDTRSHLQLMSRLAHQLSHEEFRNAIGQHGSLETLLSLVRFRA